MPTASVNPLIFKMFPGYQRGIVIVRELRNAEHDNALKSELSELANKCQTKLLELNTNAKFSIWQDAFRRLGTNPNRFPPAHCALRKRIQRPEGFVPFINRAVAIMNMASIKFMLPVGGDDMDMIAREAPHEELTLRFAAGEETFSPLGEHTGIVENPSAGEIIYTAGKHVLCRRWVWRNAKFSCINASTANAVINVDALVDEAAEEIRDAQAMLGAMFEKACKARVECGVLTAAHPVHVF